MNNEETNSKSENVKNNENISLEALKNMLKSSKIDNEKKSKNEEVSSTKKNKIVENSNSKKTDKSNEEIKDSFNFSLGEIESQIEMLKNLSIKP